MTWAMPWISMTGKIQGGDNPYQGSAEYAEKSATGGRDSGRHAYVQEEVQTFFFIEN